MNHCDNWPASRFPTAFWECAREGKGVLLAENLPWTTGSARVRFYSFLRALARDRAGPMSDRIDWRWHFEVTPQALVITSEQTQPRSVEMVQGALLRGVGKKPGNG